MTIQSSHAAVHQHSAVAVVAGGRVSKPGADLDSGADVFFGLMSALFAEDPNAVADGVAAGATPNAVLPGAALTTASVDVNAEADSATIDVMAGLLTQPTAPANPLRPATVESKPTDLVPGPNLMDVAMPIEQVVAPAGTSSARVIDLTQAAAPKTVSPGSALAASTPLAPVAGQSTEDFGQTDTQTSGLPSLVEVVTKQATPPEGGRRLERVLEREASALMQPGRAPLPVAALQPTFQPPVPEVFASISRGKRNESDFFGVSLGVGAQQTLDHLGLSAGQDVAEVRAAVADTQVVETVSYWITQGVQNAELTLDGLGDERIKVHIELDGNQARVDFRSDQPQVRQVLEAANAQLKNLLMGQGLDLAGMSVGSFAQGQQQSDPRASKPMSARVTGFVPVEGAVAASPRAIGLSVGRALDLYV